MSAHASQAFSIAHCTDSEDLPVPIPMLQKIHVKNCNIDFALITLNGILSSYKLAFDKQQTSYKLKTVYENIRQASDKYPSGQYIGRGLNTLGFGHLDPAYYSVFYLLNQFHLENG